VFDSLFQLYQKGSLPIDVILDLFNLDGDEIHEKLRDDMFTVKGATFNEMVRNVLYDMSDKILEETDIADRMKDYLKGPDGKQLKAKRDNDDNDDSLDGWGFHPGGRDWNNAGHDEEHDVEATGGNDVDTDREEDGGNATDDGNAPRSSLDHSADELLRDLPRSPDRSRLEEFMSKPRPSPDLLPPRDDIRKRYNKENISRNDPDYGDTLFDSDLEN